MTRTLLVALSCSSRQDFVFIPRRRRRFLLTRVSTSATFELEQATILGTPGNDVIRGTEGPDVIVAGDGNDKVWGLGGDDVICGGLGNDRIDGGDRKRLDPRRHRRELPARQPAGDVRRPAATTC